MRNVKINHAVILTIIVCVLTACGRQSGSTVDFNGGDTLTTQAELLTMVDHGNGIIGVTVTNPWDKSQVLSRYLLVDTTVTQGDVTKVEGYTTVLVPVNSAIVYSSVHTSAFEELDATDAVTGVADATYFRSPEIRRRLADGRIADIGNSMSPSLEKIIELSPEVAIVSPYENSGQGILDKTGITIINMADYMESTPTARAEWILFVGALTGNLKQAQKMYTETVSRYNMYKGNAALFDYKPLVITELPYSGVWYQPGGASYMATLIRDAGGRPLLADDTNAGSVQLDIANVYNLGGQADVWLIKSDRPLSLADISSVSPLMSKIKAFSDGEVFVANTSEVNLYDDLAFHPDRVLGDYIYALHGLKVTQTDEPEYFRKAH